MGHAAQRNAHFEEDDPVENPRRRSNENDLEAQNQDDSSGRDAASHSHILEHHTPGSARTEHHSGIFSPLHRKRADTAGTRSSFTSLRRRRVDTSNVAYSAVEMGRATGWMPGAEPGLETSDPAPPYSVSGVLGFDGVHPEKLEQRCEITCVDFSEENWTMVSLDNDNLQEHLTKAKPEWSQVRWINVNGLSWDVIRTIGNFKGLHRLAIEDMINTRSRTKADWYRDHTFVVLPLQKLVNINHQDDSDTDSESEEDSEAQGVSGDREVDGQPDESENQTKYLNERQRRKREEKQKRHHRGAIATLLHDFLHPRRRKPRRRNTGEGITASNSFNKSSKVVVPWAPRQIRTLQQWHTGPNQDRTQYMQRNAALSRKGLSISMEQVSIFLCADNTVISFFEYSAQDIEIPILKRLQTPGTILRQSCDASMLLQAILDGIVDLAIPVTIAYEDTLGDLELEVLTDPAIHESKQLYILTSEIAALRNAIAPVAQLMSALKDHKSESTMTFSHVNSALPTPGFDLTMDPMDGNTSRPEPTTRKSYGPPTSVTISPLTALYLGDALDHAILIRDAYDQMRRSADNLVDLIFNTISAHQNESMKQLTLITCFFLPLTFMTGYFGMNFDNFSAIHNSDTYFWEIAIPVSVIVGILMLWGAFSRWVGKVANKALIRRGRRRRLAKMK